MTVAEPGRPTRTPTPADVSVVVCTRDRSAMLAAALSSIRAATPAEVEVLVVDSASTTADTRRVATEAGVRYVRSDVKGLSIARNLGLAHSTREIVVFTDDDCETTDGWIQTIIAPFANARVGAVTGRLLDHTLIGTASATSYREFTRTRDGLDAGHGALMAFRRSVLVGPLGFDDVLGAGRRLAGAEDLDIFCRVIHRGHPVVHEPRAVVHHMNTRDDADYRVLLRGYGLGMGALAGKWLRLEFTTGLAITSVLLGRAMRRAVRRWRDPRQRPANLAMVAGILAGLGAAARMKLDGERFVDTDRPPITTIPDTDHAVAS